jgi:hypothetical protein
MARIGPAFATLRDPARRRAYDEAIGLRREPAPKPQSQHYSFAVRVSPGASGFIGSAARELPEPIAEVHDEAPPLPAPRESPSPAEEGESVEPRERVILEAPGPQPAPGPDAEVEKLQAKIGAFLASGRPREERETESSERPPEWKRFGLAGGGVVLAVALAGAWAGMKTSAATDPKAKAQVASLLLPPPTTFSVDDANALGPAKAVGGREPARAAAAIRSGRRIEPRTRTARASGAEDRLAGISQSLQEPYYGGASVEAASAPAAPPAKVTEAAMPLPNSTIARTLHRIGYNCGSVASTSPIDSAGGYKVTCTSGHSYSAKPVRGRYHFRRLGGG